MHTRSAAIRVCRPNSLRALGLFSITAVFAGACVARRASGMQCTLSSECEDRLSCVIGTCRVQCVESRDCPVGAYCLPGDQPSLNVCLPSGVDLPCSDDSVCGPSAACRSDSRCHTRCAIDADCPSGRCTTATGYCNDPNRVAMPGADAAPDSSVDAAQDVRPPDVVLDIPAPDVAADIIDVAPDLAPDVAPDVPLTPTRGFLLLYRSDTGAAVYGGIAGDGSFFVIQMLPTQLGAGWTHVVTSTLTTGGTTPRVLFYNRTTNMHIMRAFAPTGLVSTSTTPVVLPGSAPRPTHIAIASTGHWLETDQSTTSAAWNWRIVFPGVDAAGGNFSASGWTVNDVGGFLLAATANGSFFAYAPFMGMARLGGYTSMGAMVGGMATLPLPSGFSHAVAIRADDLLLYNATSNALAVLYAPAAGTGAGIMGSDTYTPPSGTTRAQNVAAAQMSTVAFYRQTQGDIDVGTSARGTPFTRLRTTTGFSGYTHVVGF